MWLIVGLGNPEPKYLKNRHNVGFRVVDLLAEKLGIPVQDRRFQGLFGKGTWAGEQVLLLKPMTFMNSSGQAVAEAAQFYKVPVHNIVVVFDDLDLAFAKLRVRKGGSAGGHRGVHSVIDALGTPDFLRVRIGIGRPPPGVDPITYVLADFSADELPHVNQAIQRAAEACLSLIQVGLPQTMNLFNADPLPARWAGGTETPAKGRTPVANETEASPPDRGPAPRKNEG